MKEKRYQDKDKVFRFLKRYITISKILILLVISIVFFIVYRNLEISRVTYNSTSSLLQLSLDCDLLFDSIRKYTMRIYNDGDISKLANEINSDAVTTRKLYGRLNNYFAEGLNIVSIYVYGTQDDCFYVTPSGVPKQSRNDFFDREAAKIIDNIRNVKALYPIPRKIKLYGSPDVPDNTANVYTFIYYGLPKITTGYFNKAIMVNVSEEWVKKSIKLWNKGMEGSICIINEDGIMVSSLNSNEMLEDVSHKEFVAKILKSKNETGYFVCNVSGAKSFVTYAYSGKLGWFFIRVIPYNSFYDNLKKIGLITGLFLLLFIAVGFMLFYIITHKAKKSIDDIIDDLKKQIRDNRSDIDKLKEEFLFNCLNNNIFVSPEQTVKYFVKYNIALSPDQTLLLVLLRLDHYYELCTRFKSYEITLLRKAIIKTAYEIFHEKYTSEVVDMKDDLVILAFNDKSSQEHSTTSEIENMIRLLQDSVEKNIQLSISAVLSSSGYTFNDANLLYTEVKQASNYRMFFGHKCIIHSEDLTLDSKEYTFPAEKEKMLLDALMLCKMGLAGKLLDEILNSARSYPFTVFNSLLLRLISSICSTFEGLENISKYPLDCDFNSFFADICKCETIDEIQSTFNKIFDNVFSIVEKKRNSKYWLLINKVIDIINQNYADENLCLNSIALKVGFSKGYLGKLFRIYTSKSVPDYINQTRIEKAAKLLEVSEMPIQDISTKVGFSSNNYFYKVFKKSMGLTPLDFRQKAKDMT